MTAWFKDTLTIRTKGKGLHPVTEEVQNFIRRRKVKEGMCFLYIPHCSASLCINESYDPSARMDMQTFFERLVPENQSWMCHTLEGGDDSSSHLRAILLPCSLTIPVEDSRLTLGNWQGIYVFEHRSAHQQREILMRLMSMDEK